MIEKIHRFDNIQILKPLNITHHQPKDTTMKEKDSPWTGEKIFTMHKTGKALIPRIYIESLQMKKTKRKPKTHTNQRTKRMPERQKNAPKENVERYVHSIHVRGNKNGNKCDQVLILSDIRKCKLKLQQDSIFVTLPRIYKV